MKNTTGFTLLELIVTVIIVGVIASMAITHVGKAVERAEESKAINYCKIIKHALTIYRAKHAGDNPPELDNINEVNQVLGLSLMLDNFKKVFCENAGGSDGYRCEVVSKGKGLGYEYSIHVHEIDAEEGEHRFNGVHCDGDSPEPCPSCEHIPAGVKGLDCE